MKATTNSLLKNNLFNVKNAYQRILKQDKFEKYIKLSVGTSNKHVTDVVGGKILQTPIIPGSEVSLQFQVMQSVQSEIKEFRRKMEQIIGSHTNDELRKFDQKLKISEQINELGLSFDWSENGSKLEKDEQKSIIEELSSEIPIKIINQELEAKTVDEIRKIGSQIGGQLVQKKIQALCKKIGVTLPDNLENIPVKRNANGNQSNRLSNRTTSNTNFKIQNQNRKFSTVNAKLINLVDFYEIYFEKNIANNEFAIKSELCDLYDIETNYPEFFKKYSQLVSESCFCGSLQTKKKLSKNDNPALQKILIQMLEDVIKNRINIPVRYYDGLFEPLVKSFVEKLDFVDNGPNYEVNTQELTNLLTKSLSMLVFCDTHTKGKFKNADQGWTGILDYFVAKDSDAGLSFEGYRIHSSRYDFIHEQVGKLPKAKKDMLEDEEYLQHIQGKLKAAKGGSEETLRVFKAVCGKLRRTLLVNDGSHKNDINSWENHRHNNIYVYSNLVRVLRFSGTFCNRKLEDQAKCLVEVAAKLHGQTVEVLTRIPNPMPLTCAHPTIYTESLEAIIKGFPDVFEVELDISEWNIPDTNDYRRVLDKNLRKDYVGSTSIEKKIGEVYFGLLKDMPAGNLVKPDWESKLTNFNMRKRPSLGLDLLPDDKAYLAGRIFELVDSQKIIEACEKRNVKTAERVSAFYQAIRNIIYRIDGYDLKNVELPKNLSEFVLSLLSAAKAFENDVSRELGLGIESAINPDLGDVYDAVHSYSRAHKLPPQYNFFEEKQDDKVTLHNNQNKKDVDNFDEFFKGLKKSKKTANTNKYNANDSSLNGVFSKPSGVKSTTSQRSNVKKEPSKRSFSSIEVPENCFVNLVKQLFSFDSNNFKEIKHIIDTNLPNERYFNSPQEPYSKTLLKITGKILQSLLEGGVIEVAEADAKKLVQSIKQIMALMPSKTFKDCCPSRSLDRAIFFRDVTAELIQHAGKVAFGENVKLYETARNFLHFIEDEAEKYRDNAIVNISYEVDSKLESTSAQKIQIEEDKSK